MKFAESLLSVIARLAVALLSWMPVRRVAQLGRAGGGLMYYLDARHRRVALRNLSLCFADSKSPAEIQQIAQENFRRIGEGFCCAIRIAVMEPTAAARHVEFQLSESPATAAALRARNVIMATGHFGSFEVMTRIGEHITGYRRAATYRAIRQPGVDKLVLSLRARGGMMLFERRDGADELKKQLSAGGLMLILVADQSDRTNGLELPFFGRPAFTNRAPGVMALRYDCSLFVPICYRIGLGRYRIEIGEPIPTRAPSGVRRSCEAITRDINAAFEIAIRRDPANWFWVHNRWKQKPVLRGAESVSPGENLQSLA